MKCPDNEITGDGPTLDLDRPPELICICHGCGYSRSCLDAALCEHGACPLCGERMSLEPEKDRVARHDP